MHDVYNRFQRLWNNKPNKANHVAIEYLLVSHPFTLVIQLSEVPSAIQSTEAVGLPLSQDAPVPIAEYMSSVTSTASFLFMWTVEYGQVALMVLWNRCLAPQWETWDYVPWSQLWLQALWEFRERTSRWVLFLSFAVYLSFYALK